MQSRRMIIVTALAAALAAVLAAPAPALAQGTQIKPYMMLVVDTSGSMAWDVSGTYTWGDGSSDYWTGGSSQCCEGLDTNGDGLPNDSRLFLAKNAMSLMVASSGDIQFGLTKFPQTFSPAWPYNTADWYQDNQGAGSDLIRYDGLCSGTFAQTIVVPFAEDNSNDILKWMNHHEFTNSTTPVEFELRADGATPLGYTIGQVRTYFSGTVIPGDTKRDCRPYSTVILTDGAESCGGNPTGAVDSLYDIPYGTGLYHVTSYVIGLAYSSTTLDQMADYGDDGLVNGTATAFEANSEAELAAILFSIIRDSVLVEVCDDADNDCDTLIDEGFTKYCDQAGVFGAPTSSLDYCTDPGETVCDGVDDNCDTVVDEGLLNLCGTCGTLTEVCDGVDNDCDTLIDEGLTGCGCVLMPEICNNADDDCDTIIDNGLTRPCGTDVGECVSGTQTCTAGVWGTCVGEVGPTSETCNGLDDDCNGVVDGMTDTCSLGPDPCDLGECVCGYTICISGTWSPCMGGVGPGTEVCDGLDNDCDGTDDNGDPGGGAPCGTDVGECTEGTVHCVSGALACTGGTGPTAELCNCLDDDCDGSTDEGNPEGGAPCGPVTLDGIGLCEAGVRTCMSCSVVCIGAVYPAVEDCNGLDDDCNTLVDDGIATGGTCGTDEGECTAGVDNCIAGAWVCVGEVGPTPEVCDGLDNDCDGSIDEGNPGGGLPCGSDVGICEPGVTMCDSTLTPPAIICFGEIGPETEVCNGLDDDCNGLVDDGLGLGDPCGTDEGVCEEGRWVCNDRGELECMFGRGPSPEICDCLDNDCDALVDEENPCPEGVCVDCSCAGPCNPTEEWPCPSGRVCMEVDGVDGYWCVGDPCEDVVCEEECDRCLSGACVDPCVGVDCGDNICVVYDDCSARCVPDDCYAPGHGCEDCERCRAGECEEDPCCDVTCPAGQFCREGTCHDICGEEDVCDPGWYCYDGECVEDPCYGVTCTGGRICVDGTCVEDPCEDVVCRPEQVCIDGECMDPPCAFIDCPEGTECVDGTCVDTDVAPRPDETPEAAPDADTDALGEGQDILATGAGGCAGCTVTGGGDRGAGAAGLLLAALALLGIVIPASRRRTRGRLAGIVLAAGLSLAALGCNEVPFCIGDCTEGDGSAGDAEDDSITGDADTDAAEDAVDVVPDAPGDTEDESDAPEECYPACSEYEECCPAPEGGVQCVDLMTHLNNCGACGTRCELPNAYNACVDGECVVTSCDVNFYDCEEDDPSDITTMGCETVCFRTMPEDTVCDYYDNDCDCVVDDDIDFTTDPENCGDCGVDCRYANAEGVCSSPDGTPGAAVCSMGDCNDGYHDLTGGDTDGCEYECTTCEFTEGACVGGHTCCTSGGDETCNGMDDDCDGTADEGDPGGGVACEVAEGVADTGECEYGTTHCVGGAIACEGGTGPVAETCDGLDNDCDGTADDGDPGGGVLCGSSTGDCEFGTTRCVSGSIACEGGTGPVGEICDGHDNDCNGSIDDGSMPGEGVACGTDVGECTFGSTDCVAGSMVCIGGTSGTTEACNGLDDDCDGSTDEDFFFLWDPDHCGDCTTVCRTLFSTHAISVCSSGTCTVVACEENWWPGPSDPACIATPSTCCSTYCEYTGTEVCDGVDNDCDTLVDTADSSMASVSNFCESAGECAGSFPVCTTVGSTTGWFCNYGSSVTVASDGIHIDPEPGTLTPPCDDLDNDCDGETDEHLPLKGTSCSEGIGSCLDTGVYICNPSWSGSTDPALDCDATPGSGTSEVCNGLDDDCDGTVDDFSATAYSVIGAVPANGMYIFAHEASKPNATSCDDGTERYDSSTGALLSKACSRSGVQPWTNVSWTDARLACQNLGTGWDLCTAVQWEDICLAGYSGTLDTWSFATSPQTYAGNENTCNGNDFDTDCPCVSGCTGCTSGQTCCLVGDPPVPTCVTQSTDDDDILDTGSRSNCRVAWGSSNVYDLSGNVKEWTRTSQWVDLDGDTVVDTGETFYDIRGGASNQPAAGLTCQFDFTIALADFTFFNLGFRCCHP